MWVKKMVSKFNFGLKLREILRTNLIHINPKWPSAALKQPAVFIFRISFPQTHTHQHGIFIHNL